MSEYRDQLATICGFPDCSNRAESGLWTCRDHPGPRGGVEVLPPLHLAIALSFTLAAVVALIWWVA